jgi:hypothetical protein
MLCPSCRSSERQRLFSPVARGVLQELSVLLCERCGAVLPPLDETEALLAKLAQLSRFGLAAGAGPILAGRGDGT